MGTLYGVSQDCIGHTVNGIQLGEPATDDGLLVWDDSRLPDGVCDVIDGELTIIDVEQSDT